MARRPVVHKLGALLLLLGLLLGTPVAVASHYGARRMAWFDALSESRASSDAFDEILGPPVYSHRVPSSTREIRGYDIAFDVHGLVSTRDGHFEHTAKSINCTETAWSRLRAHYADFWKLVADPARRTRRVGPLPTRA